MFVSDWMTKKVFTVAPDDGITEALTVMKENGIKHLPVVKGDRLKGIVSDRDIRGVTPSSASSLDVYELHYLLAKMKVKDIMKSTIFTTTPDTPVEEAAMVLYDEQIGCLPVVENDKIAGIISDRDIFRALIDITGGRHGGHRIYMIIEDRPGSIKEVADIIRKYGFGLQAILTSYEGMREGYRSIMIRTHGKGNFMPLKNEIEKQYKGARIKKG